MKIYLVISEVDHENCTRIEESFLCLENAIKYADTLGKRYNPTDMNGPITDDSWNIINWEIKSNSSVYIHMIEPKP